MYHTTSGCLTVAVGLLEALPDNYISHLLVKFEGTEGSW